MVRAILTVIFFLFLQSNLFSSTFDELKKNKKTSYLDFILLKIENRLIQRHGLLGAQPLTLRVQYQNVGSQVNFIEDQSKIVVSIVGVMDKRRYTEKKYKPKISDCNVLRNILLYGKYGYSFLFQKRNRYLTNEDMEEIFISRFLNNISLSEKEKNFILNNTFAEVQVVDPVRGNDIACSGKIAEDLK